MSRGTMLALALAALVGYALYAFEPTPTINRSANVPDQPSAALGAWRDEMVALRNEGIRSVGWIAGNMRGHALWPEVKGAVDEGGTYYDVFVRTAVGTDHRAEAFGNVSLYREWVRRGEESPYSPSEATSRLERVNGIIKEMTVLMTRRPSR